MVCCRWSENSKLFHCTVVSFSCNPPICCQEVCAVQVINITSNVVVVKKMTSLNLMPGFMIILIYGTLIRNNFGKPGSRQPGSLYNRHQYL